MSTKTLRKRIALVAVSTLGFGLVSSVAPANAATTITAVTAGSFPSARVGQVTTIPVTVSMSGTTLNDTVTIAARILSAPTTGGNPLVNSGASGLGWIYDENASTGAGLTNEAGTERLYFGQSNGQLASTTPIYAAKNKGDSLTGDTVIGAHIASTTPGSTAAATAAAVGATYVAATAERYAVVATGQTSKTFYLNIKPDVAGTYTIFVSASTTDGNLSYVTGDANTTISVVTGTSPSTITLTSSGSHSAGTMGSLVKVALKDAAGNSVNPSGLEQLKVSVSGGTVSAATLSAGVFDSVAPASTEVTLTSANFLGGVGFVNVQATTASTSATVTVTGSGTLASSVSSSLSVGRAAAPNASATAANTFKGSSLTTVLSTGWYNAGSAAGDWKVPSTSTSSTIVLSYTAKTADELGYLTIVDNGAISGLANKTANTLEYDLSYAMADESTYTTITLSHAALGTTGTIKFADNQASTYGQVTVTGETRSSDNGTVTATPSIVRSATAGTNVVRALVKDQFNSAMAGKAVTITVSGRNAARTTETLVTDASGYVSTTIADTGTAGASDVVTFDTTDNSATATIFYGAVTVGTVTVTGGNTADTNTTSYTSISTGNIGATTSGAVAFTALVKDASGNVLSGVPVTFAVDKGLITKTLTTDYTTVYTGADGKATTYAFNWVAEKQTVTATAGGIAGKGHANWAANNEATARVLSAVVTGNVITYTVKDRFGNGVEGVDITLTRTGTGFFGTGSSTSTAATDSTGTVSVQFTGTGTVKAVLAATDAAGDDLYFEAYDVAGERAETALLAAVAGTTTGTGVSFAPAGVATVSVAVDGVSSTEAASQAAADAAAEATDAANAATDAANAAAEAADAATAAAQDAADAVAALSTQVSEMVNALKKQITALTNLVIKIQKKVKA